MPLCCLYIVKRKVTRFRASALLSVYNGPSGTGASLSADNVRENNLCVIFLMSKYDPQRKGAYETIEEVQPVMERIKQMLIEDSATGCPVTKELDLTSLSTLPESGFYRTFAGWSLAFSFKTRF